MLTVNPPLPNIGFHLLVTVLGANMALCSEEELDILLCCTQDRGKF
jgi:hypothetical protein